MWSGQFAWCFITPKIHLDRYNTKGRSNVIHMKSEKKNCLHAIHVKLNISHFSVFMYNIILVASDYFVSMYIHVIRYQPMISINRFFQMCFFIVSSSFSLTKNIIISNMFFSIELIHQFYSCIVTLSNLPNNSLICFLYSNIQHRL